MTYFLIFLAVTTAAAVALYVVGLNKQVPDTAIYHDGLETPVANLPPVLLPQDLAPLDVDRLRFSLGLRGYRMDQVDEVLDRLRDELAAKDQRIVELEAALGHRDEPLASAVPAAPAPAPVSETAGELAAGGK